MNPNEILETTNCADCGSPLFEGTAGERGCPNAKCHLYDPEAQLTRAGLRGVTEEEYNA